MGYVLQASCTKCKYQSDQLIIGDGLHLIFICKNCNSVVNAQRFPFRYSWSPCPNCKSLLRKDDWIDSAKLVSSFDRSIESDYQCPRCKENRVGFKGILHFNPSFDDRIPEKGTLVHGRFTISGELEIPFLGTPFCLPLIENPTSYPSDTILELKVIGLEKEYTDDKSSIQRIKVLLDFIRYISQEDLERESMDLLMVKPKTTKFVERVINNNKG